MLVFSRLSWLAAFLASFVLVTSEFASHASAEITAKQVDNAIESGVAFLKGRQDRTRGNWSGYPGFPGGASALCTLALINAGVEVEDASIQRALEHLRTFDTPEMVYCVSLQTMVFSVAEPEKDRLQIQKNVRWLESAQLKTGPKKGAWAYSARPGHGEGDNSNTQFALLALHEAQRVGITVEDETWRLAEDYWRRTQKQDGSWGYVEEHPSTGSMTCAGISSLIIASGKTSGGNAKVTDGTVQCCADTPADDQLERAIQWLGRHFSVHSNPAVGGGGAAGRSRLFYYLYGVERVGRLSGRRFFEKHDWYREGAEMFVNNQDRIEGFWLGTGNAESNKSIATALALLYLGKGRRPVVMGKMIHSVETGVVVEAKGAVDWDRHRGAVQNLTDSVSKRWKRELTWQTIDPRAATVDDLLQTPVLYISGRDELSIAEGQKELLRKYVDQGGFIFAENCCDGDGFDRDFRQLMADLFPDSRMRLLPPDHPVWFAEEKVDSKYVRPLWGVDACCRTSVVYCPENLSCYWELHRLDRGEPYPPHIEAEIKACLTIGQNVLAYATNRRLKPKIRASVSVVEKGPEITRSTLVVPKLSHGGGSDDAPNAWGNLLRLAGTQLQLRISPQRVMLTPDDPQLYDHPMVFMHGRRSFQWSDAERKSLTQYLQRGGVLFADSICASDAFSKSFRQEIKEIIPAGKLVRLPADHPMLTNEYRGYRLDSVTLRSPGSRIGDGPVESRLTKIPPNIEALEIEGRIAVIFSPYDISCAMENSESFECKGYIKQDAARIGVNVILFALQQ